MSFQGQRSPFLYIMHLMTGKTSRERVIWGLKTKEKEKSERNKAVEIKSEKEKKEKRESGREWGREKTTSGLSLRRASLAAAGSLRYAEGIYWSTV